jgi:hypothetical protein
LVWKNTIWQPCVRPTEVREKGKKRLLTFEAAFDFFRRLRWLRNLNRRKLYNIGLGLPSDRGQALQSDQLYDPELQRQLNE